MLGMQPSFPVFNHGHLDRGVELNAKIVTTIKRAADPKLRVRNTASSGGCMGRRRAAFFTLALLAVPACSNDNSDHNGDEPAGSAGPAGGMGSPPAGTAG